MKKQIFKIQFLSLISLFFVSSIYSQTPPGGFWIGLSANGVSLNKKLTQNSGNELKGTFSGMLFGFSLGYQMESFPMKFSLNGNQGQVRAGQEFAEYNQTALHVDYEFAITPRNFFTVGGFFGTAEYELIVGPKISGGNRATLFSENPKVDGSISGIRIGILSLVGSSGFVEIAYDYGLSSLKNEKISVGKSLEITQYSNSSIAVGIMF